MPLYDFQCQTETCGRLFEQYLPLDRYQERPPCPDCSGVTDRAYLVSGAISHADAVVVFRTADGEYRYPGDPNGQSAKHYEKLGYERVELKGWAQVRKFERRVNKDEYANICRRMERVTEQREASAKARESEMRRGLEQGFQIPELDERGNRTGRTKTVHMSARGRALALAALARSTNKPRPKAYEPGFYVEAFSQDRSSREESRDSQGRRRRD